MTSAGPHTASMREEDLSARLFRQVTGAQAARYAASYDAAAGVARFNDLLRQHAPPGADQARHSAVAAALAADADACAVAFRPVAAELGYDADAAVAELDARHYRTLVRLAALLVRDVPAAEQVVRDSFAALGDSRDRLRDPQQALTYLRQAVVNRSRSVLRHRMATGTNRQAPSPDMPDGEPAAQPGAERSVVAAALCCLPARQREAVVLRYYADLSEAEIAAAMGISRGAVKSHTARGMAALRAALEQQ